MAWTDRQQSMLREMGLRVWAPASVNTVAEVPAVPPAQPAAPPASPPVRSAPTPPVKAPVTISAAPQPSNVATATAAATTVAVATLDWPALRQAVVDCRACTLCQSRRQTVFGVGHPRAHWMVVGEAPGEQEDAQGEPFVGASGRLLDKMLAALGLTRAMSDPPNPPRQVYIANTLKCRPPGNRNPSPEELLRCQPFLQRQVELVQPKVILAMGRFAVQSLLDSSLPIGQLRGKVHAWRGVPLVVTYHPAYLLRTPADKGRAWADLCLAASVAEAATAAP